MENVDFGKIFFVVTVGCVVGWSDFEEREKCYTLYVCCAKLLLDPNYQISCLNVASFLGRKASENLGCCPKINKKNLFKNLFEVCDRGERMYF